MKFNTIDDLKNSRTIVSNFWAEYMGLGEMLFGQDMFTISILNRLVEINEAFVELTKPNEFNYLAAVPLVRLQIDTLLYTFAITSVDDVDDFLICFMNGDKWTKLKDREGNELKESYLLDKLSQYYKNDIIKFFYKETSDFVHLSPNHMLMALGLTETGKKCVHLGNYRYPDNERFILDIMLIVNKLISQRIEVSLVPARIKELKLLKELKEQYPDKSTADIMTEFGYNDARLYQLFFGQIREKE